MHVLDEPTPWADAEKNWSDWQNLATSRCEVWDIRRRAGLLDPSDVGGTIAKAHVIAHLELSHHQARRRRFTEDQEDQADALVEIWMVRNPGDIEMRAAS